MKHKVAGKTLNRNSAHRKALRMNFANAVFKHERVETTLAKAKALRSFIEKIITIAKKDDAASRLHRIRLVASYLQDKTIVKKLFDEIGPRFKSRPGGYTRILRLADHRVGDGTQKAILELVDNTVLERQIKAAEQAEVVDEVEAGAGA
ncbi:MAG: 50S ribosomal protein L17 [Planctomycetes bacterium]|nr:50S ribosomal protein L17 [Planctomycetota bacterium]